MFFLQKHNKVLAENGNLTNITFAKVLPCCQCDMNSHIRIVTRAFRLSTRNQELVTQNLCFTQISSNELRITSSCYDLKA